MYYSGFYKNGGRDGLFTYYDEEGKLTIEQIFKNDLKLSEIDNIKRIVSFYKWGKATYEGIDVKIKYKYYDENKNLIKVEKIKKKFILTDILDILKIMIIVMII